MTYETKVLLEGLEFPEGPRWHDGKLWFSDINAHRVMTVDLDGSTEVIAEVPGGPSGLGWLPDGRLLVVSMSDNRLLRLDPSGLTEVADMSDLGACNSNDMVVDTHGRAYIGHSGYDVYAGQPFAHASIMMVTPEGNARVVADEMAFPNGIVITPDGRTLVVAETADSCLTAFDIQPDGLLSGRRLWAKFSEEPTPRFSSMAEIPSVGERFILPDGICLDAEGAIWVANPFGREVLHVREGGQVIDRVALSSAITACMLGGTDRRTLFITIPGRPGPDGSLMGGRVEMVEVDVPGAGLP